MEKERFKALDNLDKTYKPLILKWLSKTFFNEEYNHSFKDQWISWSIWDGELTIRFDDRVIEQKLLKLALPIHFFGTPQQDTLNIVNKNTFYLQLSKIVRIEYPDIVYQRLLGKHVYGKDLDIFTWEVKLKDGSLLEYTTQDKEKKMVKGDFTYNHLIEQRAFIKFLETFK